MAVVKGVTEQALDEVATTFGRLAFSPVITEGHDFGATLHDPQTAELLCPDKRAFPCFVWLGRDTVRAVLAAKDKSQMRRGDVFLVNDPYLTGTHMHDVKAVAPIFCEETMVAFLCVTGHWTDVGGRSPGGYAAGATSIHEEGFRIPPVRIVSEGVVDSDMMALILNNTWIPRDTQGDIFAQLSSVQLGQDRLEEIFLRFGPDPALAALHDLSDTGEQLMREIISGIPDGMYHYRDCLDNDGITSDRVWIDLQMTVDGDSIVADFSRSDPPVQGGFNSPLATTVAATHIALHHLFPEVLLTGGSARPVEVIAGPDTVVGAEFPRACEAYGEIAQRVIDTVLGALGSAVPERAVGGMFGTSSLMSVAGVSAAGQPYIYYPYLGGGNGASQQSDGLVNGPTSVGLSLCPQVEVYEARFPVLHHQYAIREDSGGVGRHRGGLGVVWEFELLEGEGMVSAMADRASDGPHGAQGGLPGASTVYEVIRPDGSIDDLPFPTKFENVRIVPGDRVLRFSPGGGGVGDPAERDPQLGERDSREGYVTLGEHQR
jgi:N-methylhydantoinase B